MFFLKRVTPKVYLIFSFIVSLILVLGFQNCSQVMFSSLGSSEAQTSLNSNPQTLDVHYSSNPVSYYQNLPIDRNILVSNWDQTGILYKMQPSLPQGLILNSDGSLSGTPTLVAPATVYVLTAERNGSVIASAQLNLEVKEALPIIQGSNQVYSGKCSLPDGTLVSVHLGSYTTFQAPCVGGLWQYKYLGSILPDGELKLVTDFENQFFMVKSDIDRACQAVFHEKNFGEQPRLALNKGKLFALDLAPDVNNKTYGRIYDVDSNIWQDIQIPSYLNAVYNSTVLMVLNDDQYFIEYTDITTLQQRSYIYSVSSNSWQEISKPGRQNMRAVSAFNYGSSIILIDFNFATNQAETWKIDPQLKLWTLTAAFGPATSRNDVMQVWTGRYFFYWGGKTTNTSFQNDGWVYDAQMNQWSKMNPPDANFLPRTKAVASWSGSEFIIWGGLTAPESCNVAGQANGCTNTAYAYSPTSSNWRQLASSPDNGILSFWDSAAFVNGELFALNGVEWFNGYGAGSYNVLSKYRAYNPTSNQWRYISPGVTEGCAQQMDSGSKNVFSLGNKRFLKVGSSSGSGSFKAISFYLEP